MSLVYGPGVRSTNYGLFFKVRALWPDTGWGTQGLSGEWRRPRAPGDPLRLEEL